MEGARTQFASARNERLCFTDLGETLRRGVCMRTILLIDDDSGFRSTLAQYLSEEGWRVLEAGDGKAGLLMAQQHRPAVVLCDLLMPRGNGYEVCRTLRSQADLYGPIRIIVATGSDYTSNRENAVEAGAHEYLVKPINPRQLTELLAPITNDPSAPADDSAIPGAARIRFWGVRGSIPTPGPDTVYFGGNTSCVEVRSGNEIIILDSGTGIRPLGLSLQREFNARPLSATLLISHTHWDHIQGFPFFVPAYDPKNRIRILGFDGARRGLERTFSSQMESPYFPISMQQMPGNIRIEELDDFTFNIGDIPVQAAFMNHPGVCVGYRLFTPAGSIAYLPDNELFERQRSLTNDEPGQQFGVRQDARLTEFVQGADVLIIDSQYDASEYPSHAGWGHSCADDSVGLAIAAGVRRLFLFHHDPNHDDNHVRRMLARARDLAAERSAEIEIDAAREGFELVLPAKVNSSPAVSPARLSPTAEPLG